MLAGWNFLIYGNVQLLPPYTSEVLRTILEYIKYQRFLLSFNIAQCTSVYIIVYQWMLWIQMWCSLLVSDNHWRSVVFTERYAGHHWRSVYYIGISCGCPLKASDKQWYSATFGVYGIILRFTMIYITARRMRIATWKNFPLTKSSLQTSTLVTGGRGPWKHYQFTDSTCMT